MSQETGDLTKKTGGQVATLDFVSDSGMGLENIDKDDLALPVQMKLKKSMQSMLKAQKRVCFIIQLQKNCMMEKKEYKLFLSFTK